MDVVTPNTKNDGRWWMKDATKGERHRRVIDWVKLVRSRQEHWRKRDLLHAHLYGNLPILGFGPNSYSKIEPDDGRLTMNLVKAKSDTYASLICRSEVRPLFLTNGASGTEAWSLRRRAKGLQRWTDGKMYESRFYDEVDPLCVLETCIFDYGIDKVSIQGVRGDNWKDADVCIERAYHWEMVIDDAEALSGKPRNLAQRRWIDRWVAAETWPAAKAEILDCPKSFEEWEWGYDDTSDQILVTEAWHLPSDDGRGDAKDGRHVICIENADLLDEPYDQGRFPFAFLRQTPAPWGIRGMPIAAQLRPVQIAINQMLLDIQDNMAMFARGKWVIPRRANVEQAAVDDDIASMMLYDGAEPPKVYFPQSFPPDAMEFLNWCWEKADEIIGISSYASAGIVPSNLKSGKAQEVALDTRDGRFLVSSNLHDAWVLDTIDLAIDRARVVAKHRPEYASRYQAKRYVEIVKFSDVDMKRDEFDLDCEKSSALATSPGAKYQQLQDMFDRGLIDMPTFRQKLDFPDIDSLLRELNSPHELADKLIERFLDAEDPDDPNIYMAPAPDWPLQVLFTKFLYAVANASIDEVPAGNLDLLRRFKAQVEDTAKKAGLPLIGMAAPGEAPTNNTMPAAGPGGPGGPMMNGAPAPGPPPGSPLQ